MDFMGLICVDDPPHIHLSIMGLLSALGCASLSGGRDGGCGIQLGSRTRSESLWWQNRVPGSHMSNENNLGWLFDMCQGWSTPIISMGDGHQPNSRGLYIHYKDWLFLGGGNSNIFDFHPDPWGNDPGWYVPGSINSHYFILFPYNRGWSSTQ